jgi:hypothetical protein
MIGIFKQNISYQSGCVIYNIYSGEHREYEFLKQNIPSHILKHYEENGTLEVIDTQQTPQELEIQEPVFEIMYKTTQIIQDKDGNEIEVGTQLTAEEFKKKGFTKKKLEALIQEEKVMEVKIVK